MILKVFSIYDTKTEHFAQPFFQQTTGECIRSFTELSNDANTMPGKHPGDFSLMELGSYDDLTGTFTNLIAPLNLGLATQYKRAPESQDNLFTRKAAN